MSERFLLSGGLLHGVVRHLADDDRDHLWETLSPSPELRDHIDTYQRLTMLYAAVRQAYTEKVGFIADLAYKTRRLIEGSAQ